jgi:hypothetical protein
MPRPGGQPAFFFPAGFLTVKDPPWRSTCWPSFPGACASPLTRPFLKEVPGRLAAYLIYLAEGKKGKSEVILEISKNQLASLLGTIPETLSRILAKLTREGFIKPNGPRQIQLLDRKGLEELASGGRKLA